MKQHVFLVSALLIASVVGLPVQALAQASQAAPAAARQAPAAPKQAPAAQPPAGQKPAAPPVTTPRPARPAASARLSMTVFVTDTTGAPVPDVHVKLHGPIVREGVTTREGTLKVQGLRAGDYRLHLEADGFVTLEKDFVLRGSGLELEVTLSRAPAPPKPAEPAPAPRQSPAAAALPPPDPNASVDVLSVVDWFAKNRLERGEPRRESVVARTPGEAASLLQVRDALRDRLHADADEVIYVISGSASFSSKGRVQPIEAGALLLIPRGVPFSIENRGKEPLWALSVLAPGVSRP